MIYILQFINTARFMASSLPNLVNNPSDEFHRIKCKFGHDDKKCQTCGIKYMYCDGFLEYKNFKDDLIEYKCLICNKSYLWKLDEKSKQQFFNTYKFSNQDNNKFIVYYCCEKVFMLTNIWRIEKIQWNNVTRKRRFSCSLKYGRYY